MQLQEALIRRVKDADSRTIFSDIVDVLRSRAQAEVVWLQYISRSGHISFFQSEDLFDSPPLEWSRSLCRVALTSKRLVCEANYDLTCSVLTKRPIFFSLLVANPLELGDGCAVLTVGWRREHFLSDDELRAIEMCTKLGGVAMESEARYEQLLSSYHGLISGLLVALEMRDFETVAHSRRVTTYTLLLAECMGVDPGLFDELALGAALHDVGKIALSDAILRKPGKLTNAEYALVQQHPVLGYDMLRSSLRSFPIALEMIRHHHERFDGAGYPDKLAGCDIPFAARMLALADSFDVMTTDRPYKRAMSIDEARHEVLACRGTQFCPQCVDAFMSMDPATLEAVRRGALDRSPIVAPRT